MNKFKHFLCNDRMINGMMKVVNHWIKLTHKFNLLMRTKSFAAYSDQGWGLNQLYMEQKWMGFD